MVEPLLGPSRPETAYHASLLSDQEPRSLICAVLRLFPHRRRSPDIVGVNTRYDIHLPNQTIPIHLRCKKSISWISGLLNHRLSIYVLTTSSRCSVSPPHSKGVFELLLAPRSFLAPLLTANANDLDPGQHLRRVCSVLTTGGGSRGPGGDIAGRVHIYVPPVRLKLLWRGG